MTSDNIKSGVMIAAIAAAAYVAYQAFAKGKALTQGVAELWDNAAQKVGQISADAQSAVQNNFVAPFERGQAWVDAGQPVNQEKSFNELMYGNYGYTGQYNGQNVAEGEWLADEASRRYSAEQLKRGSTPPAQSNNGAAFGMYPSAMGSNGQGQKGQQGVTGSW